MWSVTSCTESFLHMTMVPAHVQYCVVTMNKAMALQLDRISTGQIGVSFGENVKDIQQLKKFSTMR